MDVIEEGINIEQLLAPITSEKPVGEDPRNNPDHNSSYHRLRSLRSTARDNERQQQLNGEKDYYQHNDWFSIFDLAHQILLEESKDLEVCAWLIEASTRLYGYKGLGDGFLYVSKLINKYGASLYPAIDEDGVDTQLSPLAGLNGFGADGALISPLRSIALTSDNDVEPIFAWECQQIFEIERINDENRKANRIKSTGLSIDYLNKAVESTENTFFIQLRNDLDYAINAFEKYQYSIDSYAKDNLQPTGKILETLSEIKNHFNYLIRNRELDFKEESFIEETQSKNAIVENTILVKPFNIEGIKNRNQALQELAIIAKYFKLTEPHSPISYSLEQAMRWADMPLTELICELIPDDGARDKFKNLVGIQAKENIEVE